MSILDELKARGLYENCTDPAGLADLLATKAPVSAYAGYDPTSPSLHVGNLVPTILLKRLQLAGHRPIIVVGGATGMIGDPSGKSVERNLLDDATLQANVAGIRAQLSRLMDFNDPKIGAQITNNADWTRGVTYLEFLRDIGKHLTINYMLGKDSVKNRLEGDSGISYTEFSYMLLQAFDFVKLAQSHDCRVQVGGNDQYGNITAGCELGRKMQGGPQLFGLTAPLMLDSTGQKMGKTSTGERIWLDAERTTPYAFYQYWLNLSDDEAARYVKWFSLKAVGELEELVREHTADRSKRLAQRELARAMTSWVHGDAAIATVESANKKMFADDLTGVTEHDLAQLASTMPTFEIPRSELAAGIGIVDLLARVLEESKGNVRRLIVGNGAYLNNVVVTDVDRKVTLADLATETMLVVRSGKKNYRLVRVR